MTKKYIAIGKTDLFNNSMGLCRNFTPVQPYYLTALDKRKNFDATLKGHLKGKRKTYDFFKRILKYSLS